MAVTLVTGQTANSSGTGTTRANTFPGNTTNGNLIDVRVSRTGASAGVHVTGVSDSVGNNGTLTKISSDTPGGRNCEIWTLKNITGGTTPTVTVTFSASVTASVAIQELTGADTVSPVDASDTNGSDSTTTSMSASAGGISSSTSGCYGSEVGVTETGGQTFTAGGSWTQSPTVGGRNYYGTQQASGSISSDTCPFTSSVASIYRACGVIYKPPGSGTFFRPVGYRQSLVGSGGIAG